MVLELIINYYLRITKHIKYTENVFKPVLNVWEATFRPLRATLSRTRDRGRLLARSVGACIENTACGWLIRLRMVRWECAVTSLNGTKIVIAFFWCLIVRIFSYLNIILCLRKHVSKSRLWVKRTAVNMFSTCEFTRPITYWLAVWEEMSFYPSKLFQNNDKLLW